MPRLRSIPLDYYRPSWAPIAGYDTAYWEEPGQTYRRESPPAPGVPAPLRYDDFTSVEGPVWLLYESAGFCDTDEWNTAEDIETISAVRGVVVPAPDGSTSPHVVTPLDVYTLGDLFAMPPSPPSEDFWGDPFGRVFATCVDSSRTWHCRLDAYHFFDFNLEGDVGMWLIAREESRVVSALMCGQWEYGERFFYAGHRRLTGSEAAKLSVI